MSPTPSLATANQTTEALKDDDIEQNAPDMTSGTSSESCESQDADDAPCSNDNPTGTSTGCCNTRRFLVIGGSVCAAITFLIIIVIVVVFAKYYKSDKSKDELADVYISKASQFIQLPNGANMHVRDEGNPNGPVLVMIHGGFGSLHNWEGWTTTSKELSESYRLISMDLLGHGLTGSYPDEVYTRYSNRDAIHSLLEEMNVIDMPSSASANKENAKKYSVAGNSFGGGIALEMALEFPNEVDTLILVDSEGIPNGENNTYDASDFNTDGAVSPDDPNYTELAWYEVLASKFISTAVIREVLKTMVYDQDLLTDDFVNYFGEINRHEGNREAQLLMFRQGLDLIERNGPTDLLPRLGELQMPTLVMNGANDTLVPPRVAETFHNHIQNSELALVDQAGHLPMIERPHPTAQIVRDFLDRNAQQQAA